MVVDQNHSSQNTSEQIEAEQIKIKELACSSRHDLIASDKEHDSNENQEQANMRYEEQNEIEASEPTDGVGLTSDGSPDKVIEEQKNVQDSGEKVKAIQIDENENEQAAD